mmetsp:Transcript_22220/g.33104  ORF Transcript_22220/g.33104 Transcript_22220/m.33104 type:complete len:249 (-) Transcript_22220:220-966(-)
MDKLDQSLEDIVVEAEEKETKTRGPKRRWRKKGQRNHPYAKNEEDAKDSKKETQKRGRRGKNSARKLKVSSTSKVKGVAGGIAKISRQGEPPLMLATGPEAINRAVKAIAIARGYLSNDGFDLRVQTDFSDLKNGFQSTTRISKATSKPRGPKYSEDDLCVKASSDAFKVAGAIAARIRDNENVGIYAKGAEAVSNMVKSVAVARQYLDESDNLDILYVPTFIEVESTIGEETVSSTNVKFSLLSQQL